MQMVKYRNIYVCGLVCTSIFLLCQPRGTRSSSTPATVSTSPPTSGFLSFFFFFTSGFLIPFSKNGNEGFLEKWLLVGSGMKSTRWAWYGTSYSGRRQGSAQNNSHKGTWWIISPEWEIKRLLMSYMDSFWPHFTLIKNQVLGTHGWLSIASLVMRLMLAVFAAPVSRWDLNSSPQVHNHWAALR